MTKRLTPLGTGIGIALLLALVWIVAAAFRPSSTYHLAPLLIVGAVPFAAREQDVGKTAPILVGVAIAVVAAAAIAALDLLQGPSLLPVGGALVEAIVFAAVGALAGLVLLRARPTS